ncbi:branched-chain amino acid ABC transporter substrate-binding protein [Ottowia testudinis]|uniref:Branched-chain amino acid ABC transporter substrate-binding protein n=1 Tax=Ottowia testudinis TaxID=2816950 RepID=A0A975H2F8_9BURK|nr:branched-chain amino acid ABC transporter substrate-binding protein [Ottowia testudinis]QTD44823.1 branched-chain amino acid ABC transporter substrate-binding protein [Ottowia testudinis]
MSISFVGRWGRWSLRAGVVVGAASATMAWAQPVQVVKIGHAAPLSGGAAHWGKDNENGARLAMEELNQQKLVIGGKTIQFELMSEDDQADPKVAVNVANRLVDAGIAGMLGHFNSGAAIPASAIYHRAGIANLSTATNPGFTKQGYNNVFRVLASDADVGAVLSKYAMNELKAKRVALIDDRTAYGKGSAEDFGEHIKALGGEIVAHEFGTDKSTDFTAVLTSLRGKKPDVIFYGGMDAQGGLVARQMQQLGIGAKLLGSDGLCTDEIVKISQGAVSGVLYCTRGGQALEQRPRGADFARRYKARFNADVLTYGPFLYDAMMLIAQTMKKADSTDPKKYTALLRGINHEGVTNTFSFDDKGNLKNPTVTAYFYKDGKRQQVVGK